VNRASWRLASLAVLRSPVLPVGVIDQLRGCATWDAARGWNDSVDRADEQRRRAIRELDAAISLLPDGDRRHDLIALARVLRRPNAAQKHAAALRRILDRAADVEEHPLVDVLAEALHALDATQRDGVAFGNVARDDGIELSRRLLAAAELPTFWKALSGTRPRLGKALVNSERRQRASDRDLSTLWSYLARGSLRCTPLGWFSGLWPVQMRLGSDNVVTAELATGWRCARLASADNGTPEERDFDGATFGPPSGIRGADDEQQGVREIVYTSDLATARLSPQALASLSTWVTVTAGLSWTAIERQMVGAILEAHLPEGSWVSARDLADALPKIEWPAGRPLPSTVRDRLDRRHALVGMTEGESDSNAPVRLTSEALRRDCLASSDPVLSGSFHGFVNDGLIRIANGRYSRGLGSSLTALLAVDGAALEAVRRRLRCWTDRRFVQIAPDPRFAGEDKAVLVDECVTHGVTAPSGFRRVYRLDDVLVARRGETLEVRLPGQGGVDLIDTSPLDASMLPPPRRILRLLARGAVFELPRGPRTIDPATVLRLPRVVLDDRVELRRETWLVPMAVLANFPRSRPTETATVERFVRRHGLPAFGFAQFRPLSEITSPRPFSQRSPLDTAGLTAWQRPRPIDFTNPWSVHSIGRAIDRAIRRDDVLLELTARDQSDLVNDGHVAELAFEIDLVGQS
jgi:hypothetical protein